MFSTIIAISLNTQMALPGRDGLLDRRVSGGLGITAVNPPIKGGPGGRTPGGSRLTPDNVPLRVC